MLFQLGLLKTIFECLWNVSLDARAKQSSWQLKIPSEMWTTEGQSNIGKLRLPSRPRLCKPLPLIAFIICCSCCYYYINNPIIITRLQSSLFAPRQFKDLLAGILPTYKGLLRSKGSHFQDLCSPCPLKQLCSPYF